MCAMLEQEKLCLLVMVGVRADGLGQDLDGDLAFEIGVRGAIDLAHSAFAKLRDDFKGPDLRAYLHRDSLALARLRSAVIRAELWRGAEAASRRRRTRPRRSSRELRRARAEAGPPEPRAETI